MDNSIGSRNTVGSSAAAERSVGDRQTVARRAYAASEDVSMGGEPTMRPGGLRPLGRRFRVGDVVLGRYQVKGELGQGGMGVVYRCLDRVAGIDVALKALPPEVAHDREEMEDVRANFRLVSKLHHPNIANLNTLECDEASGDYYLVMECVDGYDVRQWARRRWSAGKSLTLDEVTIIAHRIAEALDYAHDQKVIHRDIKPGNVRVNLDGDVKVLDFGLAAQLQSSQSRVTRAACCSTSGTGPYMAPEQWKGQQQGAAADQYALAVTVYELLSGMPPFSGHDSAVLHEAVLKNDPEPLKGVPPHVNAALLKGLAKEPGQRFRNCVEFVAALSGDMKGFKKRGAWGKWLVAAAAAGAVFFVPYQVYSSVQKQRAAERLEAAQRVAERQRQVTELQQQVQQSFLSNDLDAADRQIEACKKMDAELGEALRQKWTDRVGERDAKALGDMIQAKWGGLLARASDPDQGAVAGLRELKKRWEGVEQAQADRDWPAAISGCKALREACIKLEDQEVLDKAAKAAAAAAAEKAKQAWSAKTRDEAKVAFDQALGGVRLQGGAGGNTRGLLDRYAGAPWRVVSARLEKVSAESDALSEAAAWKMAAAALPEAAASAEAAMRLAPKREGSEITELEKKLKGVIALPPDYLKLGELFVGRTNAPTREIQNHVINGVAAGLMAMSRSDVYTQGIRGYVTDPASFEDSLNDPCPKCVNAGSQTFTCSSCRGDGVCKNTGCVNGKTVRPVFNGGNVEVDCVVCKGSAKCAKCQGTGSTSSACFTCKGKRRLFSADRAKAVSDKELQAAADGFVAERDAKKRETGAAEAERERAAAEELDNKLASVRADLLRQAEDEGNKAAEQAEREVAGQTAGSRKGTESE